MGHDDGFFCSLRGIVGIYNSIHIVVGLGGVRGGMMVGHLSPERLAEDL